jgi:hypothetical protein
MSPHVQYTVIHIGDLVKVDSLPQASGNLKGVPVFEMLYATN